jgi:glycosyltransferase involved in cell wall biosynthesis
MTDDAPPTSSAVRGGATAEIERDDPPLPGPDRPERKVLMVLFHFPPIGGVPMARNVRNVQHLARFGWIPVVVAARDATGWRDPASLSLVPSGTQVLRALCPEPRHLRPLLEPLVRLARAAARSRSTRVSPATTAGAVASSPAQTIPPPAPSALWRLFRLLSFPDNQVAWLPFALGAALRAGREAKLEAVYSTSPPVTSHVVAGVVKRLTGVPWVAEFRDPWLGNPITETVSGPRPWVHRRLQVKLERWIVGSADRIVFVSRSTALRYRARYPRAAEMVTIPNGHDREEAVPRPATRAPRPRYRIVWTGSLHRPGELRVLLEGLELLLVRRPELADVLELVFFGDVSDACRAVAAEFEPRMDRVLHFAGFVPRQEALEAVAGADAALLMLGAGPGMGQFVPGKLFDYLGQDQQILAILPPGDARAILEELDWGVIADPDPRDVERAIERLLALPPPARPADPDGRYARLTLTRRLADTLDAALGGRAGPTNEGPGERELGGAS